MRSKILRTGAGLLAIGALFFIMVKIIYPFCIIRDTGQVNGQLLCCDGRIRWWHPNTLPVPITINSSGSKQAPGEETAIAVRRAMQTWNDVSSSFFEFTDAGLTDQDFAAFDGINIVVFDTAGSNFPIGTNVLAFSRTFTTDDQLGFRAIESDLVFNARDFAFIVGSNQNSFDIETITLHELGHHLGLSHAGGGRDTGVTDPGSAGCGPVIQAAVMFFAGPPGAIKRTLHPDDIAGITQIYPNWTVEGVVTDASGAGLSNVLIRFQDTSVPRDTIVVTEVRTDDFGLFKAPVLDSTFTVTVSKFGFQAQEMNITFLTPGSRFEIFTLQPLPTGIIQGTVRDRDTGQGITAQIELFAEGKIFKKVTTDANGHYIFSNIPISDTISTVYDKFRIEPVLPYPIVELQQDVIVLPDQPTILDFELTPAEILLVDDDGGEDFENFIIEVLKKLEKSYVSWDVNSKGSIKDGLQFFPKKKVIWMTGNRTENFLSSLELDSLRAHLTRGGKLFLSGQNIAEHLAVHDTTFLFEVLHVGWGGNTPDPILHGVPGDPVGNGLNIIAIAGGDGARNQTSQDLLIPDEQAHVSIVYDTTKGTAAGVRIEEAIQGISGSRIVFFGFGFEGINNLAPQVATREQVLFNVLAWLSEMPTSVINEPSSSNIIEQFALLPNYP
ncbi:MAG: carboxypeptidase regulatory-like domain-containing protein, partial [bacterium]